MQKWQGAQPRSLRKARLAPSDPVHADCRPLLLQELGATSKWTESEKLSLEPGRTRMLPPPLDFCPRWLTSAWNSLLPPPLPLTWGWASLLPNPAPKVTSSGSLPHFTPELDSTFSVSGSVGLHAFYGHNYSYGGLNPLKSLISRTCESSLVAPVFAGTDNEDERGLHRLKLRTLRWGRSG